MAQMLELNTVKVSYRFSSVALNETMAHGRQGWYMGAIIKQVVKRSLQSTYLHQREFAAEHGTNSPFLLELVPAAQGTEHPSHLQGQARARFRGCD